MPSAVERWRQRTSRDRTGFMTSNSPSERYFPRTSWYTKMYFERVNSGDGPSVWRVTSSP